MRERYRDYSQTFTYNFSKIKEPTTCKLTVYSKSEDDSDGRYVVPVK